MSYLTYEEYKQFYDQYGRTIDRITKDVRFADEKQFKIAYKEYENNEKIKIAYTYNEYEKMIGDNKEMKQNCDSGKMPKIHRTLDDAYDDELTMTQRAIEKVGKSLIDFVIGKNKNYGNSALEPLEIFSKHITSVDENDAELTFAGNIIEENKRRRSLNLMLTRLDDKLSRIKNAKELRKNDVSDILGYLILVCVNLGWDDFDELID